MIWIYNKIKNYLFPKLEYIYTKYNGPERDTLFKGNKEIGCIEYECKDKICEIELLYVSQIHRNKGYGKKLLEDFEEKIKKKGAKEIKVSSLLGSETYYEKRGFKKDDSWEENNLRYHKYI
jgi:N-acetylglutamate synthase-like GNAT family acetyltransferase